MRYIYTQGQKRLLNVYGTVGLHLRRFFFTRAFQERNSGVNRDRAVVSVWCPFTSP